MWRTLIRPRTKSICRNRQFPPGSGQSLQTYFAGGTIQPFGNPIVTADNGTYIVDGHHRWSAIVLINPNTQVAALDLGYVPNPQTALKQAQIGVGANRVSSVARGGDQPHTTDEQTFDVRGYIETGAKTDEVLDGSRRI